MKWEKEVSAEQRLGFQIPDAWCLHWESEFRKNGIGLIIWSDLLNHPYVRRCYNGAVKNS